MSIQAESTSDILWGCEAIAAAIGRSTRATFHLLENGQLPAKKIGGRWCVSRRALLAIFEATAV
jgi:hypothetical protein